MSEIFELESAIIGYMLCHTDYKNIVPYVSKEHFTDHTHKMLVDYMNNADVYDVFTVSQACKANADTLMSYSDYGFSMTVFEHNYNVLVDRYNKIKVVERMRDIVNSSAEKSLQEIELNTKELFDSVEKKVQANSKELKDVLKNTAKMLVEKQNNKGIIGVETGYFEIDDMTKGLKPKEYSLLGARPSMGKTTLMLNMALNAAKKGKKVVIYSFETEDAMFGEKLIYAHSGISSNDVYSGSKEIFKQINGYMREISELPIRINDKRGMSILDIRKDLINLKNNGFDFDLVVIDYLQIIRPHTNDSRERQVAEISFEIKTMSGEFNAHFMALSQFSREGGKDGRRPQLTDLRDSGSLEQDADVILFVHRESYYKNQFPEKDVAEIIVAKNRNGATGVAKLGFIKSKSKFTNLLSNDTAGTVMV